MKYSSVLLSTAFLFLSSIVISQDTIALIFIQPPTDISVQCVGDVPAMVDVMWSDNVDGTGFVTGNDVSNGLSCPETITRTWTYTDMAGNTGTAVQVITVNDFIPPVFDPAPADITVSCIADVPAMIDLGWTDNCAGTGFKPGTDLSDGMSCPETITRTWTHTDPCGNTASTSQTIIIMDLIPPTASNPDTIFVFSPSQIPAPNTLIVTDADDNCGGAMVAFVSDVSDNYTCETIKRTYSITDDCNNQTLVTQIIKTCSSLSLNNLSASTINPPWPNPTEKDLNFNVHLNDYNIAIYSINGSVVSIENYQVENSNQLSLLTDNGIYIVQLTPIQGGQSQNFRIVKSK